MIAPISQSTINTSVADLRLFEVLRTLVAATPLYVFINALRGR